MSFITSAQQYDFVRLVSDNDDEEAHVLDTDDPEYKKIDDVINIFNSAYELNGIKDVKDQEKAQLMYILAESVRY